MTPAGRFVAYYAAYVAALHMIDGPWRHWKQGHAGSSIDPWTVTHVAWGVIAARMGLTRNQVLVLSALNEVAEHGARALRPDLLWGTPETPANVVVDLAATWAGWEVARQGL